MAVAHCLAASTALLLAASHISAQLTREERSCGCDDATSPDGLTRDEARARQHVALAVGKFVAASEKCVARCREDEGAGKLPPGGCVYGAETDGKTIACLIKAANKAFDVLEDPELDAPECLAPQLGFALPVASGLIEEFDPLIFCGSPSAAFVPQSSILR